MTTYISYYQNHGYKVVFSGQIYPDIEAGKINENLGFLASETDFRFFEIDLKEFVNLTKKGEIKFLQIVKNKYNHIKL